MDVPLKSVLRWQSQGAQTTSMTTSPEEKTPMPIDYRRDDQKRLITVTLTQPFAFDELPNQTDGQWAEG